MLGHRALATGALATIPVNTTGPINADLTVTEGDDTLAATVTLDLTGSLATVEANDIASVSGALTITSSAFATEDDDTLSADATMPGTASLEVAEADDVPSAAGTVALTGSVFTTEDDDASLADATLSISAIAVIAEEEDTLSAFTQMPIVHSRRGGIDDRQEYERWLSEWQESLRGIIDRSWRVANGEIDPVTFEPIPPPDLEGLASSLGMRQRMLEQAALDNFVAEEARQQEEEAIAVLLLAA